MTLNEMSNVAAWTKRTDIQVNGVPTWVFDAAPIGFVYVGECRARGGFGQVIGYSASIKYCECGKARAASKWDWKLIGSKSTLREAIEAAAAYVATLA